MQSNPMSNLQIKLTALPSDKYPLDNKEVFQTITSNRPTKSQVPNNHVLVKVLSLSVDAANRLWISGQKSYRDPVPIGSVMDGLGVGQVIYSNSEKFKIGQKISGQLSWQQYAIVHENKINLIPSFVTKAQDMLGVYGISGLSAYSGLFKIGKLQKGQTIVISAASGGVGEIAVQIAKALDCRIIGIAGSAEKCKYVCSIGAQYCINYKTENVEAQLKRLCPKGFDVYFDNVGGEILDAALMNIKDSSRIVLCGSVSTYYGRDEPYKLKNYPRLIIKRCTMEGFIFFDYAKQFPQMIQYLADLVQKGQLKVRYDYSYGLQQCPNALKKLLLGGNNGKVIVKVDGVKPKL